MTTYNYNYDIATSRAKVIFKLLLRWRGSVWQAVWIELLIWLFLYGIMSIIYRLALTESQQVTFEKIALFCNNRMSYIPLNFMLSFFVTTVVNRWITQFANLGMIDNIALFTSSFVKGSDERGRQLRRNIVRYCVLSQALVFRDIHLGVRKRFPTLDTLVASGFMMKHEKEKFEECKSRYAKYWLPFNWALHLLNKARQENRMDGEIAQNAVAMEIRQFRTGLSLIWTYDWVPLPIMYPQLVYLAVHTYFFVCLFARQFIIRPGAVNQTEIDLYFPIMSTLEFVFYMGWLKVAMALLNPFGDDDEDFDCNFLLDRNLTISLTSVDEAFDDVPDVLPDVFYNDIVNPLYSQDSAARNVNFYTGSANKAELPESVTEITMVPHPANERIDRYIQRPARRRRTSIVTVAREPLVREERTPSLSSHVINVFRRRKSSSIKSADISAARKPRSSTDIGIISPSTLTVPNGAAAYQNPTFVHIDEAPEENHENGPTHHYYSGNVRSHITRSFNTGTKRDTNE